MNRIVYILTPLLMTACDPVHSLTLENQTNRQIEVICYPGLAEDIEDITSDQIVINGKQMSRIILDTAETMSIGLVIAKNTPSAQDLEMDYLEIRYGKDTLKLSGKNAIFSTIQKVENLNWRLIVK